MPAKSAYFYQYFEITVQLLGGETAEPIFWDYFWLLQNAQITTITWWISWFWLFCHYDFVYFAADRLLREQG